MKTQIQTTTTTTPCVAVTFDGATVTLLLQAALQAAPILEERVRSLRAGWPDTYCDTPEWAAFLLNKHALDHALKNLKRA